MHLAPDAKVDEFIAQLNGRLGIANGLGAMGVPKSVFGEMADKAMKDHCHGTNPRIATRDAYLQMLEESY